ncbi:MAG: GAF domain-containing protein [Anaerolineales bacterium]|nr:MAG: GAF domain-containing protein [Anaerolineales bacterium]
MVTANREPSSDPMWPRLESWLAEALGRARTLHEAVPAELDIWSELARAAASGDRVALTDHLSRLNSAPAEVQGDAPRVRLIDVVAAQFESVLDVLSASDTSPDSDLWRYLMSCQSAILSEAACLTRLPAQPIDAQLRALIEFGRQIVTILNLEALVEQVVKSIYQGFGYEYVHLYLVNAADQQVVLRGGLWRGQPADPGDLRAFRVGEGIVGWVAAHGEPVMAPEVASDARHEFQSGPPNVRSEIAVPLAVGGRVLGVLDVQSDQASAFGEADLFLLQALAEQVAIAVQNARLHLNTQRRLQEQTILYETSAAISANLDADTVLRTIAVKMAQAVAAGGCAICQWDPESDTIISVADHVAAGSHNPSRTWRAAGQPIAVKDDPVARQVLQTRRPVLTYGQEGQKPATSPLAWQAPGWRALLALPLQLEGRIVGMVELYDHKASRKFTADDIQLCQTLANQTAMAMERIRLFDETRQRLSEVSELYTLANQIATSLDLSEVLDAIVRTIRRAMGCRGCCIFLLDEASQTLEIRAAAGLKPEWREAARLHLGEGIAGRAAAEARSIYVPDTLEDHDYIFFDEEVRSLLAVPLQLKGSVIGVINVDEEAPDAFGPDQERLLTIAAAQAAITIENARLFSEVLSEKQRTDAIIRYMADGLLMLDRHGVVLSCNPALARMLGMERQDIMGRQATAPDADSRLRAICEPAIVRERTGVLAHEVEIPRTGLGGEALRSRVLRVFSTAVLDEIGQRLGEVRVVHDVTREREIEEVKAEFFSTISHELRTPLFSIQGFARLILEGQVPDEKTQREFLGIIGRQAEQLAQLVNNLLNISRLDSGVFDLERGPVRLTDVLQQSVSKLRGIAQGRKIALEAVWPEGLPLVTGDRDWLEQVATNLIGNAIKFTPEGGRVTVAARRSNGEIVVEISDTGTGIPADSLERIFIKFYRVPEGEGGRPDGTGLGLHIARKIVEAHGGRIWAESSVGQGSTFRFTLPYE